MAREPRRVTTFIVVSVAGVLVALAALAYLVWSFEARREAEARRRAEVLEEIRRIGKSLRQYSEEFERAYPGAVQPDGSGYIGWSRSLDALFPGPWSPFRKLLPPATEEEDAVPGRAPGDQHEPSPTTPGETDGSDRAPDEPAE